jgi:hypothetical protein
MEKVSRILPAGLIGALYQQPYLSQTLLSSGKAKSLGENRVSPKAITRKDGPPKTEDLAKPVSEVRSGAPIETDEFGVFDDGEVIEIDLDSFTGGVVTRARAKSRGVPRTTYRSPGSIFQHIVPTQMTPSNDNTKPNPKS